ncbi:hypothetical protein NNJEOMEG_01601 [Fundidesulfovibrio magnetotacticus]|uniref:PNPLA domain-containing protein n=2 Tax=Fundidesulfovibrio magnetotacticus TaxID=2730080 RepID=A0A6V8LVS0_9BACT|nr:hypothetical protein NNJEOMEG_01601 [Fundidesulfovibrio magnetotacticus]
MGSEGLRAFAAIPVFQFLREQGLGPDLLVGAGGGAFIAALAGAGFDLAQVEEAFRAMGDKRLFTELDPAAALFLNQGQTPRVNAETGLADSARLRGVYARVFRGLQLENLSTRTVLTATDVRTGESVALDQGSLAEAVYAAGNPFPLTPPLVRGEQWLADGSYTQPLPTLEAARRGMDVVVAVYAQDDFASLPAGLGESYLNVIRSFRKSMLRAQMFQTLQSSGEELVVVLARPRKRAGLEAGEDFSSILEAGTKALERMRGSILDAVAAKSRRVSAEPLLQEPDPPGARAGHPSGD